MSVLLEVSLLLLALAPREATVIFRVEPATLPEGATVYVTGNHEVLGDWNPGSIALQPRADGAWEAAFSFARGTVLEYKITLGSWDREALAPDGAVPPNSVLVVMGDTTVAIRVPAWKRAREARGAVTGTVHTHRAMVGEGVLPRDVHVWIPPGYDEGQERYPVLYLHDGQQVFDPSTSTFGIDWQIDETSTELIRRNEVEPFIAVAVNNTQDRYEEYSDSPKGASYRRFLIETLKPFIDRTYRTMPDREHTAVMGSSMGGLVSFLLAWYHAETFSAAACLSPAFFPHDLRKASSSPPPALPVRLYLDNGGVGLDRRLQAGCDRMLEILQDKGMTLGEDLVWFRDPEAEHREAAWAARAWRPLTLFFGTGAQAWVRQLPPPAPRGFLPYEVRDLEGSWVVGFTHLVPFYHWDERVASVLGAVDRLLPPGQSHERVLVLTGPDERANLEVVVGVEADESSSVPQGVTRVWIPPDRWRIFTHGGSLETLGETLGQAWLLVAAEVDSVGPVVVRVGASPGALTIAVPLSAGPHEDARAR